MFSKQNFSKNLNLLEENLQSKMLNTNVYTKSYVRTKNSLNQRIELITDNHCILSSLLKSKVKRLKYFKESRSNPKAKFLTPVNNLLKKAFLELTEGHALNTQKFLYRNRKNGNFRFHSSALRSSSCANHIDLLRQSIEGLRKSNKINKSSLLVLTPKRGGFLCYASGILGYLPKKHGNNLFCITLSLLLKNKKFQTRLKNILYITDKQSSCNNFFLLRLHCFLGKFRFVFRRKRKKFSLSRKKKGKKSAFRRYTMLFLSSFNNQ
jgi:hypothetical protein